MERGGGALMEPPSNLTRGLASAWIENHLADIAVSTYSGAADMGELDGCSHYDQDYQTHRSEEPHQSQHVSVCPPAHFRYTI